LKLPSAGRDLGIRRNLIYKWREQLNTKQDKALKRTANNADTPYHKAAHSELLKQNKQLKKDLKLSQMYPFLDTCIHRHKTVIG
jgi:transposase